MGVPPENRDEEIRTRLDQKLYREAFELLLTRYSDKVVRLAYSMLGNLALAEETAQDIFLRIWCALPRFRGDASLSTWIFAISRNTCLTALKKGRWRGALPLDEPSVRRIAENVPASASEHKSEPDFRTLVSQLPEQYP